MANQNQNPIASVPMNRWISLESLTADQLQAAMEAPVKFEWNHGFRHGRELIEVRLTVENK
tara:strand:- start:251 stop:433 length:183 start_codon:yes stop_codon:yes gene_type:complete